MKLVQYCIVFVVYFLIFLCFLQGTSQVVIDSSMSSKKSVEIIPSQNANDPIRYQKKLKSLKEAITFSDLKKEFQAYQSLAKYHSDINHKNIDSTIYYFDRLESKMAELTKDGTLDSIYKAAILGHYLDKGKILSTNFGLLEDGLESYYKAYPLIEKNDINFLTAYDILRAQNYRQQKRYSKAIQILKPRMQDTAQLNPLQKIHLLQDLAKCYQLYNRPKQSYAIHKNIINTAKKNNATEYLWAAKNEISYDLFLLNNTREAILEATSVREFYQKLPNNKVALFTNSKYLGEFYQKTGDIDKAIIYYKDALTYPIGVRQFPRIYDLLITCYKAKGSYTIIADLYEKKEKTKDTLTLNDLNQHIAYKRITNTLKDQKVHNVTIQNENDTLKAKAEVRKLYVLSLSLILGLLLISLWVYQKYYSQKKEVKNLRKNEEKLLRETITLRENQLEASHLKIKERRAALFDIKTELEQCNGDSNELDPIENMVDDLLDSNDTSLSALEELEQTYTNFTLRLKMAYPKLSNTEIRYCLLTKLEKSIKDTAYFLNVSENTVKTARNRVKKKMQLASSITLRTYLKDHFDQ